MDFLTLILLYLCWLFFAFKRLLTYLHALQQDDYNNKRLLHWIAEHKVFDKRMSLALLATALLSIIFAPITINIIAALCFACIAYIEKDPRRLSKKKLALTERAKRILFVALFFSALLGLILFFAQSPLIWIVAVQLLPLMLTGANIFLKPAEAHIQRKFWMEAHEKLLALSPTVIAITGSFGKTSVKHILGHIFKMGAPTLVTPGSVNTPMGITRIIREDLNESHQYFIVEMGAYGKGSIARLCRLTPPDSGIITAIGAAHFERFKSLENVAETKFELADAVFARGGKMIVHENTLAYPYPQTLLKDHANRMIKCGPSAGNRLQILDIKQEKDGLHVNIQWDGQPYTLHVSLYGLHHGINAALCFAMAVESGIPAETVITALKRVPQIAHRLEVKKQGEMTYIDDAFNSNPQGFRAGLDLLPVLKGDGRAILITPGMIELGEDHERAHRELGEHAGRICDIALIVNPERIPSFIAGFRATGSGKDLHEFETFQDAAAWLDQHKKPGDVVLIENDLPDIYEQIPQI